MRILMAFVPLELVADSGLCWRPSFRRRTGAGVDLREVVNAIAYLLWTGCSWRALPKDFPAFTTRTISNGPGRGPRRLFRGVTPCYLRFDAGKVVLSTATRLPPRPTAEVLLQARQGTVRTVFADGAYGGNKLAGAQAHCPITVEVVKKAKDDKGFGHPPALGGRAELRMVAPLPTPLEGLAMALIRLYTLADSAIRYRAGARRRCAGHQTSGFCSIVIQ